MTLRRSFQIGAVLCLALFVLVAALVMTGFTQPFDRAVLNHLRIAGQPGQADLPDWLLVLGRTITLLGGWTVRLGIALTCSIFLIIKARKQEAAALFLSVATGAVALAAAKAMFGRARPDLAWRLVQVKDLAFPSGHAMGAMIVFPMAGFLLGRLTGVARGGRIGLATGIVVALLIGSTRVLLGVHWISDVIGGWLLGGAWACASLALIVRFGEQNAGGVQHGIAPGAAVGERRRDGNAGR